MKSVNKIKFVSFLIIVAMILSLSGCANSPLQGNRLEYKPNIYFSIYENTGKMLDLLHKTEFMDVTDSAIHVDKGVQLRSHEYQLTEFKGLKEQAIYDYFNTDKVYAYLLHGSVLTINNCGVSLNTDGGPMDVVDFGVRTRVDNYEDYYDDAKLIADEIKAKNLSEHDEVAYLNQKIIDMVQYDHDSLAKYDKGNLNPWNISGVFNERSVVCEGYTKLFHLVCDQLGIPSLNVLSLDREAAAHMWNTVYVDDSWMMVDVTSNDAEFEGSRAPTMQELEEAHTDYLFLSYEAPNDLVWNKEELNTVKDIQFPDLVGDRLAYLRKNGLSASGWTNENMKEPATKIDLAILFASLDKNSKLDNEKRYKDVPDWAHGYVNYAVDKGFLKAGGLVFGSEEIIGKVDLAKELLIASGDTKTDKDYLVAAAKKGLIRPARCLDNTIEKSDVVTILYDAWVDANPENPALY